MTYGSAPSKSGDIWGRESWMRGRSPEKLQEGKAVGGWYGLMLKRPLRVVCVGEEASGKGGY